MRTRFADSKSHCPRECPREWDLESANLVLIFPMQDPAGSNRVARTPRAVGSQGAGAIRARLGRGGSVQAPPQQVIWADSGHGNDSAGVGIPTKEGGLAWAPITQGVGAESIHADESAVAG
ncbi:unnamed protein product [Phytophthora fragariaefolia]|uniref:Unnamed protein product n=1 Tax=Phytophthora fragariaefolia TaxID=1490495 RepID=A0A9W6Y0V2_9STRA|nr:unnamed protein product [Phytophthora fragariaefolia]